MKKFKIADIEVIKVHEDGGFFKPHTMYNAKTKKKVQAESQGDHLMYKNDGYVHMEKGGKMPLEEALTDYSVQELPQDLMQTANAEVERDEFIKYPNEQIAKVQGEKHENDGVKLMLPPGAQVLSHDLELGKTEAKRLSKEYPGLKFKAKMTWSDAQTLMDKKSGYVRKNKEQEEVFKTLNELETEDETTRGVNERYLNGKILKLENEKKIIEESRTGFFDVLFARQEDSKGTPKGTPIVGEQMLTAKDGGQISVSRLNALASKHGISKDKAFMLLGGEIPKFLTGGQQAEFDKQQKFVDGLQDATRKRRMQAALDQAIEEAKAGETTETTEVEEVVEKNNTPNPPKKDGKPKVQEAKDKFESEYLIRNSYANHNPGRQKKGESGAFGGIGSDMENRLSEYKRIMPTLYKQYFEGKSNPFESENVTAFQNAYNHQAQATLDYIKDTDLKDGTIDKAEYDKINDYYTKQVMFSDDANSELGIDGKFGLKTSSREGFAHKLFDVETTKKLNDAGFTHLSQLSDNPEAFEGILTNDQLKNATDIYEQYGADFKLMPTVSQPAAEEEAIPPAVDKPDLGFVESDKTIKDKGRAALIHPFAYVPGVSDIQPIKYGKIRKGLVDPVKVGIEEQLREQNRSQDFVAQQLDAVPDSQRSASLAGLLGSVSEQQNKAFTTANKLNQNAIQQAELTNINQRDAEQQTNLNYALSGQDQMFRTQAAYEDKKEKMFLKRNQIARQNYFEDQELNQFLALNPDVGTDLFGTVTYDPSMDYQLGARGVDGLQNGYDWKTMVANGEAETYINDKGQIAYRLITNKTTA